MRKRCLKMKKLKKFLSVIVSAAVLLSMASVMSVSSSAADDPVFSLNLVEEDDSFATVSVKLESGSFSTVDMELNGVGTNIGGCVFIITADDYDAAVKSVKKNGGQEVNAVYADGISGKFSAAVSPTYDFEGSELVICRFTKNSAVKLKSGDVVLEITVCYDADENKVNPQTVNNISESGDPETPEWIYEYSENYGENITWSYNEETAVLTLSGTGAMYDYFDENGIEKLDVRPWNGLNVETVVIENGITSVGSGVFYDCPSLKNVVLAESVESIGAYAFSGCDALEEITVLREERVAFGEQFADGAVICCYEDSYTHSYAEAMEWEYRLLDAQDGGLEIENGVVLSYSGAEKNLYISGASKIGYGAFENNNTIETVELSSETQRIFNAAFRNCTGLEKIIIPAGVTSIGSTAFDGCEDVIIYCVRDSAAESYALAHGMQVEYIELALSAESLALGVSETAALSAQFNIDLTENVNISWTSGDETVATVAADGTVTAVGFGTAKITATAANGCEAECTVSVNAVLADGAEAEIDYENGIITGVALVNTDADSMKALFDGQNVQISTDGRVGTGDRVLLCRADGSTYKELQIVIFGDVNGDGAYDGMDATLVSFIADGMLTEEQVGRAAYLAADCNHDGAIDGLDVSILNEAGVLLAQVDQGKDGFEVSSVYQQYVNLISQSPETEITENEPTETVSIFSLIADFIKRIIEAIINIFR